MSKLASCTRLENILELSEAYELILFDLWGVIIEGPGLYKTAKSTLEKLMSRKKIMFVSNSSGSNAFTSQQLGSLGLDIHPQMIITAGELTKRILANPEQYFDAKTPKIYNFGLARNRELWQELELPTTDNIQEAGLIIISLAVEEEKTQETLYQNLELAASLKIPAICANSDQVWRQGGKLIYCAGHFARKYESFGGKVHYMGKPFEPIFLEALKTHPQIDKKQVLMIGDTPETDVLGANKVGINCALVTTGNMLGLLDNIKDEEEILERINKEMTKLNLKLDHVVSL